MATRILVAGMVTLVVAASRALAANEPPAEIFFQPPTFKTPRLSPNGSLLGALTRHDDRRFAFVVMDLRTKAADVIIKESTLSVADFGWKTNDLVIAATVNDRGMAGFSVVDLAKHKSTELVRLNDEGTGTVVSMLPDDPDHILCTWWNGGLRKIDLRNGKPEEVEPPVRGVNQWIADATGTVWAGAGFHDEKFTFVWRAAPRAAWQRRDQPGVHDAPIFPLAVMPDHKRLVVIDRTAGNTARLAYFDLATTELTEIFRAEAADITSVVAWGAHDEPGAAVWEEDRRRLHFFLPEAESCYRGAARALPELDLHFASFSSDNQRVLLEAHSASRPSMYFLMDRANGQIGTIGPGQAGLAAARLAPSHPFQFQGRDGLNLTGRITLPVGVEHPPLVICVGPGLPGMRTDNRYDAIAQFFASRGFATARIHVRGTAGFGREFQRAGDLQVAGGMVRDLEDGATWLVAHEPVDHRKVALLGESWGGVIALHAAAETKVFRGLMNFATPTNTRELSLSQVSPSDRDDQELTTILGGSAAAIDYLKSIDPLKAAARLLVPSFHYYPRQPSANAMVKDGEELERTLRKAGAPHTMFMGALIKPETDEAKELGRRFEAATEFLRKNL